AAEAPDAEMAPAPGGGAAGGAPAMTGAFPAIPAPGAGGGGGGGGGAGLGALEELRNHPRFAELAQMVAANPQMLPQLLMTLEQTNPGLVQAIRENPEAFMNLMQGAVGGGGGGGQDPVAAMLAAAQEKHAGDTKARSTTGACMVVRLTPEENEAVLRLAELGFDRQMAAQAYLACDKNEELAANFLFENGMTDD
ncbi:unnamed protein product, partial [Polarella glacialis]